MTTLQLARAIADAVLKTKTRRRSKDSTKDAATQAVIDTLHATETWFMAWPDGVDTPDPDSGILDDHGEPIE